MPMPDKKRRKIKDHVAAALVAAETRLIRKKANSGPSSDYAASKHRVYMVLDLEHGFEEPAYSVMEVAAGAVPRSLLHVCAGMSFAAVATQRGPRIVGVGKDLTTVFDPKTATEVMGPRLVFPKLHPVLIPHGGKLYALSRSPSVVQGLDFVPWFFVADFSSGATCGGGTVGSSWHELPPPPIFPFRLNPLEYRNPPKVRVESYAVVGSYILLSVHVDMEVDTQQDKGTCAFNMDAKQWEMVDDKNLPFIGQAVPLGDRHFIAHSRAKHGAVAVYYMDIFPPGNSNTGKTHLSIVELSVTWKSIVPAPGQLLCSMGKDSFRLLDPSPEAKLDRPHIVHRTYSVASEDDAGANSVVVVKQQSKIFKVRGQYTRLAHPLPVVAALSMTQGGRRGTLE